MNIDGGQKYLKRKTSRLSVLNKLRVRSIDDEEDETQLEISEVDQTGQYMNIPTENSDKHSPATVLTNIAKEREIFLRAALQLLDASHRPDTFADTIIPSTSEDTPGHSKRKFLQCSDIIRFGSLRKANRGGAFSSMTVTQQWKGKYVELRHGTFLYVDEGKNFPWSTGSTNVNSTNESQLSGNNPSNGNNKSDKSKKIQKVIPLSVESCRCRAHTLRSSQGDCVFELTLYGGPRRLWMASSQQERDAWVQAIRSAMIGSGGAFLGTTQETGLIYPGEPSALTLALINSGSVQTASAQLESPENNSEASLQSQSQSQSTAVAGLKTCSSSWEGPAAAYAIDIARFSTVQTIVQKATNMQSYCELLNVLHHRSVDVSVPVFFVKCQATGASFHIAAEDALSKQTLKAVQNSQIWKDLQRDSISVNGDLITGATFGAEAMVGCLVRHIMDKVDLIRMMCSTTERGGAGGGGAPESKVTFDITEAQVLSCARDILVFCNRTQSGGDTYFCVDSLLCNKGNDLCILTPWTSDADPIEISVDIVEAKSAVSDVMATRPRSDSQVTNASRMGTGQAGPPLPQHLMTSLSTGDLQSLQSADGTNNLLAAEGILSDSLLRTVCSSYDSSRNSENATDEIQDIVCSVQATVTDVLYVSTPYYMTATVKDTKTCEHGLSNSNGGGGAMDNDSISVMSDITINTTWRSHQLEPSLTEVSGSDPPTPLTIGHMRVVSTTPCDPLASAGNFTPNANQLHSIMNPDVAEYSEQTKKLVTPQGQTSHHKSSNIFKRMQFPFSPNPRPHHHHPKNTDNSIIVPAESSVSLAAGGVAAVTGAPFSSSTTSVNCDGGPAAPLSTYFKRRKSDTKNDQPAASSSVTSEGEGARTLQQQFTAIGALLKGGGPKTVPTTIDLEGRKCSYCIRVEVRVGSKYRLCDSNPQDETTCNWAQVSGCFEQVFFIKSKCSGRPVISDRLVTTTIEKLLIPQTR